MTVKQLGYQLNLAIIIADDHAISHFVDYNSPQNGNCVNLTQSDGKCKKTFNVVSKSGCPSTLSCVMPVNCTAHVTYTICII